MQSVVEKVFFALIRYEFSGELSQEIKNLISKELLKPLFNLSKRHDLSHLVGDALAKNGFLNGDSEEEKRFLSERNLAVFRYEQMQYEYMEICKTLSKGKIPFIPLKGAVIRQYYPESWMRTSCDIDILVKKQDVDLAVSLLKDNLNFTCKLVGNHDVQLYSPTNVHLELHYTLIEDENNINLTKILSSVWDNVIETSPYHYEIKDDLFYFYIISHIAKHVKWGGCGVRAFIDVFVLNNKLEFSKKDREDLLIKGGLLTFSKAVLKLSNAWMLDEEKDQLSLDLEKFVLFGGVYGNLDNKVAVSKATTPSKFKYLISRIFLPYKHLKFRYPKLQKYPILYPYYLIKRWFSLIFNREKRRNSILELNKTVNGNNQEQIKVKTLLENLGL